MAKHGPVVRGEEPIEGTQVLLRFTDEEGGSHTAFGIFAFLRDDGGMEAYPVEKLKALRLNSFEVVER